MRPIVCSCEEARHAQPQCRSWTVLNGHTHRCCGYDGHRGLKGIGLGEHFAHCTELSCIATSNEIAIAKLSASLPELEAPALERLRRALPSLALVMWDGSIVPPDLLFSRAPNQPRGRA
jgi:hypothetical protein